MEYYVSGVKTDAKGNCEICDDAEANFWTLYERSDSGESQAIVDCTSRDEAEVVMSVYVERDALQQQVNTLAAENDQLRKWLVSDMMVPVDETAFSSTDAIKRQWMAEGVEILTGKLQQLIDEGTFDGKEIGVAAGAVHEGSQMAYQLRAGEQGGDHA